MTAAPTSIPSVSPLTSIPSSTPSFVGLVVSVDISRPATAALDDSEVIELQDLIVEAYGVDIDDLSTATTYVTSGTIAVTIPDSVSTEDALQDLKTSLASTLGVSEDDIKLVYNSESGEVAY